MLDYVSTILVPLNEDNMETFFNRFKDDLMLRDTKIKNLEYTIEELQSNQANIKIHKDVQEQI